MHKRFSLGTLLVCAAAEATADSGITPYGVLDFYSSYSDAGASSQTRIQSGGASTSRLGLNLFTDLAPDWRLSALLESGIDPVEGEVLKHSLFNREAHVKLDSKKYGTLTVGRQYSASIGLEDDPFLAVGRFSPFASIGAGVSGLGSGATSLGGRISRAVSYTTPAVAHTRVQFLYSPNQATGPDEVDAENMGLLTIYDDSRWRVGAGYNRVRRSDDVYYRGRTLEHVDTHMLTSVLGYHFGATYLSTGFNYYRSESPQAKAAQIYSLGIVYPQKSYALRASLYRRDLTGVGNVANSIAFGAEYHLTTQWDLYTRASFVDNRGTSSFTTTAIEIDEPGDNPSALALGARVRF